MLALVRDRPDAFRGQWHLARMARTRGDVPNAITRYDRALKLWPNREGLVQEAAAYAGTQGQTAWARDVAAWGTTRWPGNINFHRLLASNAIDMGDTATARQAVINGLRVKPNDDLLNAMQRAFGQTVTAP
jgi:predicted Zn-dependent protease